MERKPSADEPFSALAFKIMTAPHVGKLTYFRVYSGKLDKGGTVYNTRSGNKERIGRLLEMHANDQIEKEAVYAGDIVAGIGFKNTRTGDTLCDPRQPVVLESLEFPEPVIQVAVEPKTKADQDKMSKALFALSEEDPTFRVQTDEETGADPHLRHGRAAPRGPRRPHDARVQGRGDRRASRRSPTARRSRTPSTATPTCTRSRPVARVSTPRSSSRSSPPGPGGGYEFSDEISGGRIPKEYIPSVGHGVVDAMTTGTLAGFPMVDITVRLLDGDYHDVDSSEMAFKIAGTMGFKEAVRKAKPVLLEPIMAVEVVTPEDYMGDVIGDLNSRRGKVGKMEQRGNKQVVSAEVPLSEMFGYSTDLRSKTQGRAHVHDAVPQLPADAGNVQEEIVARVTGQ